MVAPDIANPKLEISDCTLRLQSCRSILRLTVVDPGVLRSTNP